RSPCGGSQRLEPQDQENRERASASGRVVLRARHFGSGMSISDRLNTIRQRLAGSEPPEHEERLLQLYWNRAELKKELTRLQDEHYRLQEKLRAHEMAAEQAREQFAALEQYLGNPEAGAHALVYFQLRALWRNCATKVERFAEQLQQQQMDRERRRQLIEFDQGRRRQLADLDRRILDA